MLRERMPQAAEGSNKNDWNEFCSFCDAVDFGYYRNDRNEFVAMWIAGWVGSWLGSRVLGHWGFQFQDIYVILAFLGALVGAFSCVAMMKANARATCNGIASKTTAGGAVPADAEES